MDEIQQVSDFPKVVDSLYIKKNVDIYITGSNAYMLSSEIATLISGRYVQIEMLPLSFKEYMEGTGSRGDRVVKYTEYLENSSFPYALELRGRPNEIRDYLDGIYNTIVVKDVVNRKKITDTMMLKSVLRFVFDNIGSPLSSKKIADTMTSAGRKIDAKTVEKYLELLRRGYDVYVGKVDELEVDFVAQNSKGTTYFQVALTVREQKTLERELRPLQRIRDHYPKFILTMDEDPEVQYEGIRRVNAREWLLGLTD